ERGRLRLGLHHIDRRGRTSFDEPSIARDLAARKLEPVELNREILLGEKQIPVRELGLQRQIHDALPELLVGQRLILLGERELTAIVVDAAAPDEGLSDANAQLTRKLRVQGDKLVVRRLTPRSERQLISGSEG